MSLLPDVWRGRVCLSLAMATVGSTVVASAFASRLDPFVASLIRFSVASPILLGICLLRGERFPRLSRREWAVLAFQAAAGSLGYTILLVAGLRHASAADAAVITGLMPVATGSVAVIALGERPGPRLLVAIALATSGAMLVALGGATAAGPLRWLGLTCVFLAVLGEACFALLNKRIATPVPPVVIAASMSFLSLAMTFVPGLVGLVIAPSMIADRAALGAMVYYGLVPTVLGFWLWYTGAGLTSGSEASAFTAVAPVTAMLLSVLLLDETMQLRHLAGMGLVLLAIAITVTAQRGR